MILADDFLQTCDIMLMLSGHVSMSIILTRECDSKYTCRKICFNKMLLYSNIEPKLHEYRVIHN